MILQATCGKKTCKRRILHSVNLTQGSKESDIELEMAFQKDTTTRTLRYGSIQFITATHLHQLSLKAPSSTKPWQQ